MGVLGILWLLLLESHSDLPGANELMFGDENCISGHMYLEWMIKLTKCK